MFFILRFFENKFNQFKIVFLLSLQISFKVLSFNVCIQILILFIHKFSHDFIFLKVIFFGVVSRVISI